MVEPESGASEPWAEIRRIAGALLADELDTLRAAERMVRPAIEVDPEMGNDALNTFRAIASDVDRLLVIDSVNGWHPDVREAREAEYRAAEVLYRPGALEAARELLVPRLSDAR